MTESTKDETLTYHTAVGEMLAKGYTNGEILSHLQEFFKIALEEAQTILRGVYDSWSSVKLGLNLQTEDDRNWHQYLRMRLLQKAIENPATPSQALALRILDSLAGIQGIATTTQLEVPLPIILVDAEEEATEDETEAI